jgi:hypothetical protein
MTKEDVNASVLIRGEIYVYIYERNRSGRMTPQDRVYSYHDIVGSSCKK